MYCPVKIKIMVIIITGLLLFSIFSTTNRINTINASNVEEDHGIPLDSSTLLKSSID